ncbi:MAG: hypothetical protein J7L07_06820 [Candidatus Odinarchaeota archaeon]|nr:hypothetical protein [Candidatus Odinarchaeota archaeon]
MSIQNVDLLMKLVRISRTLQDDKIPINEILLHVKLTREKLLQALQLLEMQGLVRINMRRSEVTITDCGMQFYLNRELRKKKWIIAILKRKSKNLLSFLTNSGFTKIIENVYVAPFNYKLYNSLASKHGLIPIIGISPRLNRIVHEVKTQAERINSLIEKNKKLLEKTELMLKSANPYDKYSAFKIINDCIVSLKLTAKVLLLYNEPYNEKAFENTINFALEYLCFFFPHLEVVINELKERLGSDYSLLNAFKIYSAVRKIFDAVYSVVVGKHEEDSQAGY